MTHMLCILIQNFNVREHKLKSIDGNSKMLTFFYYFPFICLYFDTYWFIKFVASFKIFFSIGVKLKYRFRNLACKISASGPVFVNSNVNTGVICWTIRHAGLWLMTTISPSAFGHALSKVDCKLARRFMSWIINVNELLRQHFINRKHTIVDLWPSYPHLILNRFFFASYFSIFSKILTRVPILRTTPTHISNFWSLSRSLFSNFGPDQLV